MLTITTDVLNVAAIVISLAAITIYVSNYFRKRFRKR